MREQIIATPLPARPRRPVRQAVDRIGHSRRQQLGILSAAGAALAAVIVAVVLLFGATTTTPPAYAVTQGANGTYTIVLRQLTTGIPGLNAAFREHGISETAIPMKAGCHSRSGDPNFVMHPNPMFEISGAITTTYSAKAANAHPAYPGYHYILAAKRLPNGKLLAYIGQIKEPVPTCLPYSSTPSTVVP
jgi:hypothetical protein